MHIDVNKYPLRGNCDLMRYFTAYFLVLSIQQNVTRRWIEFYKYNRSYRMM